MSGVEGSLFTALRGGQELRSGVPWSIQAERGNWDPSTAWPSAFADDHSARDDNVLQALRFAEGDKNAARVSTSRFWLTMLDRARLPPPARHQFLPAPSGKRRYRASRIRRRECVGSPRTLRRRFLWLPCGLRHALRPPAPASPSCRCRSPTPVRRPPRVSPPSLRRSHGTR